MSRRTRPSRPGTPEHPRLSSGKILLFAVITVLLALGTLELAARVLVRAVPNAMWSRHSTLVDAVGFSALNAVLVPHADRFWTTKPGVESQSMAGTVASSATLNFTVSTDQDGCRRVPTVQGARDLVAFLGDSTTFGVGVDDDQTFAALLQARLSGTQTVNLGVPGYTAFQGRLRLESFTFPRAPRVLVVTFGFNDAARWGDAGDLEYARRLRDEQTSLVARSRLLSVMAGLLRRPAPEAPTDTSAGQSNAEGQSRRPRLLDSEFAGEIGGIVSWCRSHGTLPVLLVWPQRPQLAMDQVSPKQRILLKIGAADPGVRVVNLIEVFRANGGEALFADMVHANADGNRVVAEALMPVLRDTGR